MKTINEVFPFPATGWFIGLCLALGLIIEGSSPIYEIVLVTALTIFLMNKGGPRMSKKARVNSTDPEPEPETNIST